MSERPGGEVLTGILDILGDLLFKGFRPIERYFSTQPRAKHHLQGLSVEVFREIQDKNL